MNIYIENEYDREIDVDYTDIINKVVCEAVDFIKCPYECEIYVLLTDNSGIQTINNCQRNIDAPTDVLSFPLIDYKEPGDFSVVDGDTCDYFNPESGELMLGDIIISMDRVYEQAESYNHSNTRELAFLVAHSMLHLFGYDHIDEEERKQMEDLQEQILNEKGYTRDYEEN